MKNVINGKKKNFMIDGWEEPKIGVITHYAIFVLSLVFL
jgi:hypothetical protein